jgi:glycosyltransferase involved in cell wall biosynthesis
MRLRAVLVHDWLTGMRGGEKVFAALAELFPEAPIYTLVHRPGAVDAALEAHHIHVSWLGKLPGAERHYRKLLPLYPAAIRSFELPPCDLVLSSSHAAAKAVRKPAGAMHVAYCYTPMRYLWDLYDDYFGPGRAPRVARAAMRLLRDPLRHWDVATARGVDHWIAVSAHVQERIRRIYGRDSTVLLPFADLERFHPAESPAEVGSRFLVVSALVPYKRIELAIRAAAALGAGLDIIGTGPELARLKAVAWESRADVAFLGWLDDEALARAYRRAAAYLMPGEEDFGIAPLESMASGRPVIAYARGGALETVIDGETGILFEPQTSAALAAAMAKALAMPWETRRLRAQAERFSRARFQGEFEALLASWLPGATTGI